MGMAAQGELSEDLRDKVLPLYRQGTVYVGVFQEKK